MLKTWFHGVYPANGGAHRDADIPKMRHYLRNRNLILIRLSATLQSAYHFLIGMQTELSSFMFRFGLFFLVFLNQPVAAQHDAFNQDWRWVRFTMGSGLPSNHIYNLTETPDGTVWVATAAGIAWFDGYRWIRANSILLQPGVRFTSFFSTADNQIVCAIENQFLVGDKNGFHRVSNMKIQNAVPFAKDSILVVASGKLFMYNRGTIASFQSANSNDLGDVEELWRTDNGSVWLATRKALWKWEQGEWNAKIKATSASLKFTRGILLENSRGFGCAVIDQPLDMCGLWEWEPNSAPRLVGKRTAIRSAALGETDQIIVIHESGLKRTRQAGTWTPLRFNQPNIIDIEFVQNRSNGDTWFGTQQGLFLYRHSSTRWTYIRDELDDSRSGINDILLTRKKDLWLATSNGIEIHHHDGKVKVIETIDGKPLYMVTGLLEDKKGHVWISSGGSFDGAYEWNGKMWMRHAKGTPLAGKKIHKLCKDRKDRIWFLSIWPHDSLRVTTAALGAEVYDNGKFVDHWGKEKGLPNDQVYDFVEANDGSFWFGTRLGLSRLKKGTWTHWLWNEQHVATPINRVFALATDNQNRVWFADRSHGVGFFDVHDSFHRFTTNDGLINNEVWDLKADSLGRMWISTSGGLSCYENGLWTSIDTKSGLLSAELWPVLPAGNKVYIGTRGAGVSILDLSGTQQRNPIVILDKPATQENSVLLHWRPFAFWGDIASENILTRYRIGNEKWSSWSTTHSAIIKELKAGEYTVHVQALGLFGKLDAEGDSETFTIEEKFYRNPVFLVTIFGLCFLVLYFGVAGVLRKRKLDAKLRESEAKFRVIMETTPSAILIYNNQGILFANPGAELLTGFSHDELIAMSITEVLHEKFVASFRQTSLAFHSGNLQTHRSEFKIRKKSGEERWVDYTEGKIEFQGALATVGTGFDVTERKFAEEKINANREQLRALASELSMTEERERRRMASFLHDTIGQMLAICKIKLGALQHSLSVPESHQPLSEIKGLLDQSIQNTRSLTFELSPPILHELGLAAAIEWLADTMSTQHDVHIACNDDGEPKPLSEELSTLLFHAVRELLVNVIKHAQATTVTILSRREANDLFLTVSDNGRGLTKQKQERSRNSGYGLFSIKERLTHLGGRMEIVAAPEGGVKVILVAPLHSNMQIMESQTHG